VATAGLAAIPGSWRRPVAGAVPTMLLLGAALALVNATYYAAIDRLPVAVAVVLQYTAPALVVVWSAAASRRPPTAATTAALVVALAGVALVAGLPSGSPRALDPVGVAIGLGAAASFAAYALLSERARRTSGPLPVLLQAFAVASAIWICLQAPRGWPEELFAGNRIGLVALVGLSGTLAPFLLFVWAVGHVRAASAAIAATLEPVLAAIAAWSWLGQTLSLQQVAGGVLVIAAVTHLQLSREVT
jgi:DME family drug/metabolite transporter